LRIQNKINKYFPPKVQSIFTFNKIQSVGSYGSIDRYLFNDTQSSTGVKINKKLKDQRVNSTNLLLSEN